MKMSIRKIVTGFLVCAVIVSSTSFLNGVQVVSATSTNDPAQTPKDVTSLCVRITPTEEPMPTPLANPFILFIDGDNSRTEIGRPQTEGYTTYLIVKTIEPYEKKEGYRFLGWENDGGLYQPGEVVKVSGRDGYAFHAKWEKIETTTVSTSAVVTSSAIATPATSAVATGLATATPVVATTEPMPTPLADSSIQFVDGDNSRTEIGSPQIEGYTTYLIVKMIEPYKKKEGYRFLGWKNNCGLYQPGDVVKVCGKGGYIFYAKWKRIETKKASLKIVTKANKQFIAGKKYRIKVKRSNTNKKIKWSVSNKKVAAINKKTGVLKAKKAGKVTITVTCGSLKRKIRIRIS